MRRPRNPIIQYTRRLSPIRPTIGTIRRRPGADLPPGSDAAHASDTPRRGASLIVPTRFPNANPDVAPLAPCNMASTGSTTHGVSEHGSPASDSFAISAGEEPTSLATARLQRMGRTAAYARRRPADPFPKIVSAAEAHYLGFAPRRGVRQRALPCPTASLIAAPRRQTSQATFPFG